MDANDPVDETDPSEWIKAILAIWVVDPEPETDITPDEMDLILERNLRTNPQ